MSQQILLTLNDTAGNALGQYNINTAGSALHIQAVDGAYYQFTDPMTGIGPEGIITEREGDNLLVSFDEGTDLVIENYFTQSQPGALVGMQADGGLFSYPVATAPEHVLAEELAASQTLGSEQPVWAPLGVLGAVGLVAAGIGLANDDSGKGWDSGNNGGSGSGNNPSPNTPAPNPSPNNPSNPSNPGGPNIPSPNPGNPGNPGTPTPTPNPSPYPPAPSPNPVPQPPTPNQPGSDPKPIANHDKVKGTPKEKVTIDVLDNDSGMDANGQRDLNPSSIRLLDAAGKPVTELTVAGQGKWNVSFGKVTFTPETNFIGNPTPVQYTVSDNAGQVSNKATITVTYDNGTPGSNTKGRAVITGDAKVGQTLSADINDPDGVPATGVKYQWMADGVAIQGATGPTYTVSAADKDKAISLNISYTDNRGNPENISTPSTTKVVDGTPTPQPPQPGQNHPGSVAISGNAKVGEKLTADVHDDDQFDEAKVSYQWQRDGKPITGANGKTYTLTADDEGHKISVKAEYTDNAGNKESHDSAATTNVAPSTSTNHAPTDIQLSATQVTEGKDGATVGKLTTTDPDAGDQHTYKVSDDRFEVTADGTLKLKAGQHLDYTSEKTVTLQITSDDGHGGTVSKTLTLNVQDDPNYPTPNPQPPTPPGTNHEGTVSITGEAKVGETLTATVNDDDGVPANVTYQWLANGVAIAGATGSSYQLTAAEAGKTITVRATYTDNAQHSEAPTSAATTPVVDPANPNPQPPVPPTNHEGTVTITGEAKVGETLTATVNDDDGVPANVTYQWLANGVAIAGATGSSYQLTAAEAGKTITVRATYTDNAQHSEAPISAATTPVVDPANPNPQPPVPPTNHEGTVSITGEAKVGETLTAKVDDADGVPTNVQYQWLANGVAIAGATGSSYQLTAAEAGKTITVRATYTDNAQHSEAPTSAATTPVVDPANPNPQPPQPQPNHEGTVSITGEAKVGETLTATVNDDDGVPANVTYQWLANGVAIAGATGSSYQLTANDAGKTISVRATYTDNAQHSEAPTSAATTPVVDPANPQPPQPQPNHEGTVSITGEAKVGETLTATVNDDDGVPANVTYQWLANGVAIAGATGSSYQLTAAEAGKTITVRATYTDNAQHSEAPISAATTPVVDPANPNPQPPVPPTNHEGTVSITGEAKVGETLTAKVDDADGVPTNVQYQWLANGVAIAGATGSSYQLTAAEAGKTITVRATYTDNAQHSEAPTSAATTPVVDPANPNPQPPQPQPNHEGTVSITGEAKVGETLTATVNDDDGVPANVTYQWLANGVAIAGATGSSYQLTANDAGKTISVRATYTDNAQHSEAPTSAATTPVVDPANPQPPQPQPNHEGTVSITGEAKVGETLTATVNDDDGVPANVTYQWLANGVAIAGATGSSYQLTAAEAGKTITVRATYTDNAQHSEAPISAATTPVVDPANPNPQPPVPPTNHEGTVSITGEAKVGETLTAKVDDADGVPTNVQYQWLANGVAIAGATGSSYQLTAAEAGKTITVRATYTDNAQHSEAPTSAATTPVVDPANPNPQPPQPQPNHEGDVAISGNAKVGETLTAQVHDADQFDEAKVNYQWQRDGQDIAGANGKTYTLTAEDEGHKISVKAEYTDNAGNKESHDAESGVVQPQSSTNQAPTDITLDNDKVAEGKDGATIGKLTTTDPDAGDQHTYKVSDDRFEVTADGTLKLKDGKHLDYTTEKTVTLQITSDDGHGGSYNKTFTLNVEDDPNYPTPNPQPPQPQPNHEGDVAISGNAKVGETLTAQVHDADQFDEAKVSYQWQRDGQPIANANGKTYTLTAEDEGHKISVKAEYTDNAGNKESHDAESGVVQPQSSTNQAPTDITLDNDKVAEGKDGAAIGKLTTTDPDAGDQHTYKVSDDRFEVTADGTLKLKDGKHLDYTTEKTVTLQITSDDGHGGSYNKTFTLNVEDDPNYPPVNPPQPQPNHEGDVAISGNAKVGETLTAQVHDADQFDEAKVSYQWQRDGQDITGANGKTYTLTAEDEGHKISVKAEYTDNAGNKESHDAESGVVQPQSSTNQAPTDISLDNDKVAEGKDGATVGKLTTTDPDAGDQHTYKVSDDRFEVTADGTLKLKDGKHLDYANEKTVTLQITTDDGHGGSYNMTFTLNVQDDPNYPTPNPQPPQPQPNHEGDVAISGNAKVGEKLTADVHDDDQFDEAKVSYQWQRDGKPIIGANGKTYTLTADDEGHKVSVKAEYTDNAQHAETPQSGETDAVTGNQTPPRPGSNSEGTIAIDGIERVGETLTVHVYDEDGIDKNTKITYQWLRNGAVIDGATEMTYTLTRADIGSHISARASYVDNDHYQESLQSRETSAVIDNIPKQYPNREGSIAIKGTAKEHEMLIAEIQDNNGVDRDTVTYQWLRDGNPIAQANGDSYTLTSADVGHKISVQTSYKDLSNHSENPLSAQTDTVVDAQTVLPSRDEPPTIVKGLDEKQGGVTITPPQNANTLHVSYIHDGKEQEYTFVVRPSGKWEKLGNDPLPTGAWFDENDGRLMLAPSLVDDHTPVSAFTGSGATASKTIVVESDSDSGQATPQTEPTLFITGDRAVTEGDSASYTLHLSKPILQDVTATVRIEHINTDDGNVKAEERTVTFSKGASSVALEVATQDNNEFQGGRSYRVSIVEAKGATLHDSSKQIETTINENDKPPVPKMVAGSEPGSVEITPVDGADYLNVRYRDETDFERILTLRRNKEGVWQRLNGTWLAELPEHVSLDAHSGKLTLGAKSVKDGSTIVAFNEANSIKGETGTFIADNNDGTSQHNRPGSIAIKGEAKVGVELSAEITDPDGVPDNVQYQWLRNGEKIDGATGSAYRLSAEDIGRKISVQATYEDNAKHSETPKSAETDAVSNDQLQPQNHAPTEITLSNDLVNEAQEGAVVGKLTTTDPDTGDKHTYTVNDDRFEVTADGTLKLKAGQILDYDKEPTLKLSITTDDGHGGVFTKDFTLRVQDDPLYPPINPNEDGTVTISGDPKVGSTLTAEVTDGDGVPNDGVKYQWLRDGNPIASVNGKSYTLTAEDAGHKITVKAEYDDNAKNHEAPVSQPTENVADNSAPPPATNHPGSVTLEGEAKIGHTLTAKLTDADGVPDSGITWRWYGDDKLLPGVEGQTITLTEAVKGMQLRAEALYTDKAGHAEKPISDLSPAVVPEVAHDSGLIPPPVADAPRVTLSGVTSVKEGQQARYLVSLDKPAGEDVSVDVRIKHGTTDTSDAKLTGNTQRVVIPKGETSKAFTVDALADGKAEGKETYTVEISNALIGNVHAGDKPFSGTVSAQSMIIPAYKYPTSAWQPDSYWDSVHKAGGSKVPYTIINPASGVGEKVKSDYVKLIDDNLAAGIKNIGYIRTNYQTRPIEEVKAEVDKYLELYGKDKIHGYFFDEITAQNNQGTAYMAELYRYVKAKEGDKLVMANPGTHITDAIAPYADIFVTSEVSAKTYLNNYEQPKSAFENDPKNAHRIMHMIHDVTPDQYDAVIKASRERNAGWVFPTSDTQENPLPEAEREKHPEQDGNPYNALPQNFDQLAANVNNLGMPTNPTQHDNNGKLATANIGNNRVATEIIDANSAPLEHHEPQLQPADGAVASAADGLNAAAHHSHGSDGHDVLIGDGIDAAAYSQLVSHQGEDLLQYLGQHSAELLAATRHSGSHELHGGAGDDVLIAGHGATLLEGGAGADTFAYLLDSNDAASWNEPSRILDFNPQEGDRIVLAGGEHLKAEVSHDASGQHLHVTDDAGHVRTIDISAQNGKTLTAEDILSHVEIRAPQSYSEPASSVPQTHHLPQDDHSHLI